MMRLFYAGGSIVTSDSIADAVVTYASALAKSQLADAITIPIAGGLAAKLLIGPSSQLLCVPESAEGLAEPDGAELQLELSRRARLIASPRPVTGETALLIDHDEYE